MTGVPFGVARARARERENWIYHELVSSGTTLLVGQSEAGKSWLVSSMLTSLLIPDRKFLGLDPVDPGKEWRPGIVWTDDLGESEYAERIDLGLETGTEEPDLLFYEKGLTRTPDQWESLVQELRDDNRNLVVLDNLTGLVGDTNDPAALAIAFDGMQLLANHGVPVVLIHHSSEKASSGESFMGNSLIIRKPRAKLFVWKSAKKAFRGGNTVVQVRSNYLDQPYQITATPLNGPFFEVVDKRTTDQAKKPAQSRNPEVLDKNAEQAAWFRANCVGLSQREASGKLAAEFGGSAESFRTAIKPSGRLHSLIQ